MKHHKLLHLRNEIEKLDFEGLTAEALKRQHDLFNILNEFPKDKFCERLDEKVTEAAAVIETSWAIAEAYVDELEIEIREQTVQFMIRDNKYWAAHGARFKTAEYIREYQQLPVTDESLKIIRARIGSYTDWKYPALEIGPGDGEWTKMLVACDPLYLVDYNDEFLTSTKNTFNKKYQNRLRCYTNHGDGLHMLPQDQFGFVFSWNTFNYFSFNQIGDWLYEIWKVLRPGGACMFSYNNAERPLCARRGEEHLMSFVPKRILRATIEGHKFVDIKFQDTDSTISWVEFRKPGKLTSNRTGQTLGKIILTPHVKA